MAIKAARLRGKRLEEQDAFNESHLRVVLVERFCGAYPLNIAHSRLKKAKRCRADLKNWLTQVILEFELQTPFKAFDFETFKSFEAARY